MCNNDQKAAKLCSSSPSSLDIGTQKSPSRGNTIHLNTNAREAVRTFHAGPKRCSSWQWSRRYQVMRFVTNVAVCLWSCCISTSCVSHSGKLHQSLEVAISLRDCSEVGRLLGEGADANRRRSGPQKIAPLMMVVVSDDVSSMLCIMRELIRHGADVNRTNSTGETALMWASHYGQIEYVRVLLEHNADVRMVDYWGNSAIDYARREGHQAVASMLESALRKEAKRRMRSLDN